MEVKDVLTLMISFGVFVIALITLVLKVAELLNQKK